MKKVLLVLLFVLLSSCVFAVNMQKVWAVDDMIIDDIEALYIMDGKALPSFTGPWSSAELLKMMASVSRAVYPELYDSVINRLCNQEKLLSVDEVFDMSAGAQLNLTGYAHTNTEFVFMYDETDNYIFRYKNKVPTLHLDWETWAGKSFYSIFTYDLENENFLNARAFDSYNFNFEIAGLSPEGFNVSVSQVIPYRAFISFGSDYWNFQLGRDKLSSGSGVTGNLILSDNLRFHNMLKYSAFGKKYKYSFEMSFFPHPINTGYKAQLEHEIGQQGLFYYMSHRLEGRFFSDKLAVVLTESVMYQSEEANFNLRYFNPAMIFHNYFIKENQNSMVGLELSYGITDSLTAYSQFCLDDAATPDEAASNNTNPTSLGFMLGAKYARSVGEGVLTASAETVYTYPYLYHRSLTGQDQNPGEYGLDYIAEYWIPDRIHSYVHRYIGYNFGGDAIVGDLKADYRVPEKYSVGAEFFVMLHGEKWFDTLYKNVDTVPEVTPTGVTTFTAFLELCGKYSITKKTALNFQYDLIYSEPEFDNQFVLGFGISL